MLVQKNNLEKWDYDRVNQKTVVRAILCNDE